MVLCGLSHGDCCFSTTYMYRRTSDNAGNDASMQKMFHQYHSIWAKISSKEQNGQYVYDYLTDLYGVCYFCLIFWKMKISVPYEPY